MAIINAQKYVSRKVTRGGKTTRGVNKGYDAKSYREWWLGKKIISIGHISLNKEYWGKKIRFKLDVEE